MSQPIFWSNVGVDVQTALGPIVPLAGISKADVGVAKVSGAVMPKTGDIVLLSTQGMYQVDKRLFRVAKANAEAKTFELDGEDTTAYEDLITGSCQVVSFGASFATVQGVNVAGGEPEFADVTTIHDSMRRRVPTIVSPLSFSMDNIFDMADPGFIECNKAFKSRTMRAVRLRFGNGARLLLLGYVAAAGLPTGQAQGVVQTKVSIEAQNMPTVYAS
jgi:hypothetical protein